MTGLVDVGIGIFLGFILFTRIVYALLISRCHVDFVYIGLLRTRGFVYFELLGTRGFVYIGFFGSSSFVYIRLFGIRILFT